MLKTTLPGMDFWDVWHRLSAQERQVHALGSATDEGWRPIIAWSPAQTLELKTDDSLNAADISSKLEAFTQEQQRRGRLVVGYLSYDLGCLLQGVKPVGPEPTGTPLLEVAAFDDWLEFTPQNLQIIGINAAFKEQVHRLLKRQPNRSTSKLYSSGLKPSQNRAWYSQAYSQVRQHILNGDVYQINLTHQLKGQAAVSGKDIFAALGPKSQAGFQAYIASKSNEILSLSPERFIQVNAGGKITTTPIKGTRPRGKTAAEDEVLRSELMNSSKDRAELDMITDLMRNDLGKVCKPGTVEVAQRRRLTPYPTIWHAHSNICGQLRPNVSPMAALLGVFPGGSITGCPKQRAMQIINELEAQRRGVYTGSIFTINPQNGALDSNIAIRTMIMKGKDLYLSVGGGVVYDSKETDEYQESLNKAAPFIV